jgi:hypothetical protein
VVSVGVAVLPVCYMYIIFFINSGIFVPFRKHIILKKSGWRTKKRLVPKGWLLKLDLGVGLGDTALNIKRLECVCEFVLFLNFILYIYSFFYIYVYIRNIN